MDILELHTDALNEVFSGKWSPKLIYLAYKRPLKSDDLPKENRKAILKALFRLERIGLLNRKIINNETKDCEFILSEKGRKLIPYIDYLNDL